MLDQNRFQQLWRRITGEQPEEMLFSDLDRHYAESFRSYHNANHIADCLQQFDMARHLAVHPDEVELALWFHDVIYDSRAKNNEEQSANCARQALIWSHASEEIISQVMRLIQITCHTAMPTIIDEKIIVDIDLSILGRDPPEFDLYEQQIRQEYAWVPELQFCDGRAAILRGFLERPAIYLTEFFQERYEPQARQNLRSSLFKLTSHTGH